MSAASNRLAVVNKPASTGMTLYEMEDQLVAMSDTVEGVPLELEEQFLTEFAALLQSTADKRDRVGQFIGHLEAQVVFAEKEIKRLQERKRLLQAALDRIQDYVVMVIQHLGTDPKGKYKKLEGNSVVLSVRKCPESVEILDETQIPLDYATYKVSLPATLWEPVLDNLDFELRAELLEACREPDVTYSKTAIKAAIDAKAEVPGVRIISDKYSLVRK